MLSLLAVRFEASDHPSGDATLTFSGDASIRLHVECIEAELTDLGPAWRARSKPQHPGAEPGADSSIFRLSPHTMALWLEQRAADFESPLRRASRGQAGIVRRRQ